jgi:hypothetical protein
VLDNALQVPLSAAVSSTIGQPSPAVGMTGRLSCRYGIASSPGGYAVELSITSYRDAAAAAARVGVTVDALRTPGFSPAAPLTDGTAQDANLPWRDGPLLIESAGINFVTVTVGPTTFAPGEALPHAAAAANPLVTIGCRRDGC